ncbi:ParB N-terminal domain-containing protein [Variovorax sp. UC122_21]|uniref:phage protein NinX family protein n=1 Tax=Variovorax sp. UC122_21 TaxID=3374554 RepID=UPI003756CFCA
MVAILDASELRPIDSLVPYARNSRTHSDEQLGQLADSMREWGFTMPVLVDEDGGIIAGHGRVLAAKRLELTEVPVIVAKGWSETKKRAYVIADNKLALNAGWDEDLLAAELVDLQAEGYALELTGFNEKELLGLLSPDAAPAKARARRRSRGGPMVELEGAALDAAIASVEEGRGQAIDRAAWSPSTRYEQGMPILRRERIDLRCKVGEDGEADVWTGNAPGFLKEVHAEPLVAGLRAVLAKHRAAS